MNLIKPNDELLGGWYSGADDGSGFYQMIWGFGLEFKADGTGIQHEWKNENPEDFNTEIPFQWQRISTSEIKLKENNNDDWQTIIYEISPFKGAYDMNYKKIITKGENHFWIFHEPIYQPAIPTFSKFQFVVFGLLILAIITTLFLKYS